MKVVDITSKTPPYCYIVISGDTPNKFDKCVVFPSELSSFVDILTNINYDFSKQPYALVLVQTRHSGKLYELGLIRDKLVEIGNTIGYLDTKEKGK